MTLVKPDRRWYSGAVFKAAESAIRMESPVPAMDRVVPRMLCTATDLK